jgi:hypothetical protein
MDQELSSQIQRMFSRLNNQSAAGALPPPGTLANLLSKHVAGDSLTTTVPAPPVELSLFATAAVEVWLRSIHSFLISVSLTKASPIWSSVAGYYSSHYSVRAFAHLFGLFHLHRRRRVVCLERDANHFMLRIERKNGGDREHTLYWKYVKQHPQLANDPFFYASRDDQQKSDGSHRNKANYSDHIDRFPVFLPLETEYLERRVERISTIEFSDVPVPDAENFPDIENVQVIAYHRIVKFRRLVDEALGTGNRFWKIQRNPSWCPSTLTFSVVDPVFAALYAGR